MMNGVANPPSPKNRFEMFITDAPSRFADIARQRIRARHHNAAANAEQQEERHQQPIVRGDVRQREQRRWRSASGPAEAPLSCRACR